MDTYQLEAAFVILHKKVEGTQDHISFVYECENEADAWKVLLDEILQRKVELEKQGYLVDHTWSKVKKIDSAEIVKG